MYTTRKSMKRIPALSCSVMFSPWVFDCMHTPQPGEGGTGWHGHALTQQCHKPHTSCRTNAAIPAKSFSSCSHQDTCGGKSLASSLTVVLRSYVIVSWVPGKHRSDNLLVFSTGMRFCIQFSRKDESLASLVGTSAMHGVAASRSKATKPLIDRIAARDHRFRAQHCDWAGDVRSTSLR